MTRTGAWALALLSVTVLAAAPALAGDHDAELKAFVEAWEQAFNANELDKVAGMYVKNGRRMPPNAETAMGHDGILAQLKASRAVMSGVELDFEKTVVEGTLAATHGTYKIKGPDGSVVDHGKWIAVGRKVGGSWKTVSDIWNSDRPLPE
jgi:ketosteroid isomerase-like protein